MPARRTPKVEALVVNAIRRLQDVQGSTSREISNYISQEYNVPKEETRRQVQFALRRGLSYGILRRSKGGYYSCDRDYLGRLLGNGMGDGVMEPCPAQPWRFGIREKRRKKRERRRRAREAREKRAREKRRKERMKRERRRRARTRRRRGRRPSRRRRSRRRPARRRRRRRRRTRTRRRGRGRSAGRARTRADFDEIEMEAMPPVPKKNDADGKDGDPRNSEASISEHSINERHS